MSVEELRREFARLKPEEKRRFMQEISLEFCRTMMADAESVKRMLTMCMEGPGPMGSPAGPKKN